MSVASSAALLGVPVVLIERSAMGGDCLNSGCVPSKAVIATAGAAHAIRQAEHYGIKSSPPLIDRIRINRHVRSVIDGIAPLDSVARYRALGVTVIEGNAVFQDARTVAVGATRITARRFVIATGAAPALPDIPGLSEVPVLTNETIFDLDVVPARLAIIGGGPIGAEMAQAHRRLGAEVTLIEAGRILAREDPEAAECIRRTLRAEGVRIIESAQVSGVTAIGSGVAIDLRDGENRQLVQASHLLVATGRKSRIDGLGLEKAGVATSAKGITVDAALRTSNRRIYAVGDCAGGPQFTHVAGYQAGLVIRQALFRQPVRVDYATCPRVTYCDPEVASIGLSEAEARISVKGVRTLRWPFSENDRARAMGKEAGFVKVVIDRSDRILGVTIVGASAGELIAPWALAMKQKLRIGAMIDLVLPYPTLSEASRRAALQALAPKLMSPWLGRIIRFLRMFG